MGKFRVKPVIVEAVQVTEASFSGAFPNPEHVPGVHYNHRTRRAHVLTGSAEISDWLVIDTRGDVFVVVDETFRSSFEPVDAPEVPLDDAVRMALELGNR